MLRSYQRHRRIWDTSAKKLGRAPVTPMLVPAVRRSCQAPAACSYARVSTRGCKCRPRGARAFLHMVPHPSPQNARSRSAKFPEGKWKVSGSNICAKPFLECRGTFGDFGRALAEVFSTARIVLETSCHDCSLMVCRREMDCCGAIGSNQCCHCLQVLMRIRWSTDRSGSSATEDPTTTDESVFQFPVSLKGEAPEKFQELGSGRSARLSAGMQEGGLGLPSRIAGGLHPPSFGSASVRYLDQFGRFRRICHMKATLI